MVNDDQKASYHISDKFMIRVPCLPLSVTEDLSAMDDPEMILRKYYMIPHVREALFLASPGLYKAAMKWMDGKSQGEKDHSRLMRSLLKYLIRMSSRCTPFGLFAGIATGSFGSSTILEICRDKPYNAHIRPDMQFLCTAAEKINDHRESKQQMQYFPNSSLQRIGDEYRYIEYHTDREGIRKYQLQSTAANEVLETVIGHARYGSMPNELSENISLEGVSKHEADDYINTLIDNQVLVSGFEPRVSGESYLNEIMELYSNRVHDSHFGHELARLNELIHTAEKSRGDERIDALDAIIQMLNKSGYIFLEGSIVQADMKVNFSRARLSEHIREGLADVLPVLMRLARQNQDSLLDRFRERFVTRYGGGEVPLSLALDSELGPGYFPEQMASPDDPLLDGLTLRPPQKNEPKEHAGPVERMFRQKLQESLMTGAGEIILTDPDLDSLPDSKGPFPMSFYMLAKLIGQIDDNDPKAVIQIDSAGGSSAVNLSGRFSYMDDELLEALRDIAKQEQEMAGDAILAEIVHLPQQRTGNILMRPVIRQYEIPYLARASVEKDFRITIDDIMVSVKNDMILLRSVRLNKYILPRLSNAHNYAWGALPIYRFLADMQTQSINSSLGFSWGSLGDLSMRLPRVRYRNFILHPSCWNISGEDLSRFKKASGDSELREVISEWRKKYLLPDEILLTEGDNELWIHLRNIYLIRLLQDEIKGMEKIHLKEYIKASGQGPVRLGRDAYANECVFLCTAE